jgi:hypothetical protein
MANTKISPEKITTPIQLVAAWFAILILLVSAFLITATNITNPAWAPAFLLIFAATTTLLVLIFVALMLTIFRPNLQEGKEYARWLKDKNSYSPGLIIQENSTPGPSQDMTPEPTSEYGRRPSTFRIEVNGQIAGWDQVLESLIEKGFDAKKFSDRSPYSTHDRDASEQACIWVGERIKAPDAVRAIKVAIEHWPHLKYVELSNDGSTPPDYVHNQMFIGGSTSTALTRGLRPWTTEELASLQENISQDEFHLKIRTKYK